jgi:hypothetical protein
MYRLSKFVCLLSLFISCSCQANNQFFPNMSDIPLMDGLIIQSTEDMNFDTPAGQITNIEAYSKEFSSCRVLSYYQNVLPQMGWQMVQKNKFIRDKDTLIITVIHSQNPTQLCFEITLNNPSE